MLGLARTGKEPVVEAMPPHSINRASQCGGVFFSAHVFATYKSEEMIMTTRQTAKAKQAQKGATRKKDGIAEAMADLPQIDTKWDMTLTLHGMPTVMYKFKMIINSPPTKPDGIIEGSLIDGDNKPIPGGELLGVVFQTSTATVTTVMSFKVSVGGIKYALSGILTGSASPKVKFQGIFVRIPKISGFLPEGMEAESLLAEPGETGTGTGNQTT
jgi:hypothetical protein